MIQSEVSPSGLHEEQPSSHLHYLESAIWRQRVAGGQNDTSQDISKCDSISTSDPNKPRTAVRSTKMSRRSSRQGAALSLQWQFFVVVALVLSACQSTRIGCPSGCSCNDDTLVVQCEPNSVDVLPITLNPFIQRLIIRNNKIKTIDSAMTFYGELQYLDLSQNDLVTISFENQKKLQELHLNDNKISSVSSKTFQGLDSLTVLNLRKNFLEELNASVFGNLSRLEELNLGQNRISRIHSNAFAGLSSLRILYLDDNQLNAIPTASFTLLGSLAELHVGLNAFTTLPDDPFAGLNRLSVLDLNGAGLSNISQNAFRGLPGLRSLNLSGNRLKTIPTLQLSLLTRLEELTIGQNDFTSIEANSFKGLKNIRLIDVTGANQLEKIAKGAFDENLNLETVVLASNKKLSYIEEGSFVGLPKLKQLTLRDNAFNTLSESSMMARELKQLELTDNPLHCDCQLLWLLDLLTERTNFTQIQCLSPDHLKDKLLRSLNADDLGCVLHDTRQQTLICVIVVASVATLAFIALISCKYRKSVQDKLKDYKWNKRSISRKEHEYQKTFAEDDYVVRGIHPAHYPGQQHGPGVRPIPVTEL